MSIHVKNVQWQTNNCKLVHSFIWSNYHTRPVQTGTWGLLTRQSHHYNSRCGLRFYNKLLTKGLNQISPSLNLAEQASLQSAQKQRIRKQPCRNKIKQQLWTFFFPHFNINTDCAVIWHICSERGRDQLNSHLRSCWKKPQRPFRASV